MEKVKTPKAKGQSPCALCLVPFALCLAGCVNTDSFLLPGADRFVPKLEFGNEGRGNICEVVVAWSPEVAFRPDTANRGAPAPGLGGRMYLFGAGSDCPLIGDGCVIVDLYDETPPANGDASVPLEEWRIDRATLKRLLRRDAVGWGYTLFLPWGTYKPQITQVQLRLRYEPVKGSPLYAESCSVVFNKSRKPVPQVAGRSAKVVPAGSVSH